MNREKLTRHVELLFYPHKPKTGEISRMQCLNCKIEMFNYDVTTKRAPLS